MNTAVSLRRFYENRSLIEKEIKIRTSDLIKTGRFFLCDKDDISQELRIEVFKALKNYDSAKSKISTYIKGILKKKGIDLIRREKVKWRQYKEFISVDDIFQNMELGKARSLSEFFCAADESRVGLQDIDSVISGFPSELRIICSLLESSQNVREIAKILGKSRTTINKRIKEIRKKLKIFR